MAALLLCVVTISGLCHASPDEELDKWRGLAAKTQAGMSLVAAERLFPTCTLPTPDGKDRYPMIFSWGEHQTRLRWVAADIALWIDYDTSELGKPLTGPVTVERRLPPEIDPGFSLALPSPSFTLQTTVGERTRSTVTAP